MSSGQMGWGFMDTNKLIEAFANPADSIDSWLFC